MDSANAGSLGTWSESGYSIVLRRLANLSIKTRAAETIDAASFPSTRLSREIRAIKGLLCQEEQTSKLVSGFAARGMVYRPSRIQRCFREFDALSSKSLRSYSRWFRSRLMTHCQDYRR